MKTNPTNSTLRTAHIKRLAYRAGCTRVRRDLYDEVRSVINQVTAGIMKNASLYTIHMGRKTVTKKSIRYALNQKGFKVLG